MWLSTIFIIEFNLTPIQFCQTGFNLLKAKLHHVNQSPNGHSSNKTLQLEYFATLSKETMKKLYDRYKPDFLLYGYNLDEFLPLATS